MAITIGGRLDTVERRIDDRVNQVLTDVTKLIIKLSREINEIVSAHPDPSQIQEWSVHDKLSSLCVLMKLLEEGREVITSLISTHDDEVKAELKASLEMGDKAIDYMESQKAELKNLGGLHKEKE